MKQIYFDYAATTPMDPKVKAAMEPYWSEEFGNPGSLHSFGQKASAAVFKARQAVAEAIGAHYSEIIFTGSATEANNLALRGTVKRIINHELGIKDRKTTTHNSKFLIPRVIISAIEHESVLKTARDLERDGVEVVIIPVSKEGMVDVKAIKKNLNERTVLVSVMYANNEVGTIQPIAEISKMIRNFRESLKLKANSSQLGAYPLLHTDAVQAFQYLDCNVNTLGVDPHTKREGLSSSAGTKTTSRSGVGVDLMTLSGHKVYGPKGIGVLYVKNRGLNSRKPVRDKESKYLLEPLIVGGGQEEGLRSGTENVPLIVGIAKAAELAVQLREKEGKRMAQLSRQLWEGIRKVWPKAQLNGPNIPTFYRMLECFRLPNNVHIYFPPSASSGRGKTSGEELMVALDLKGISVATGPACSARTAEPSHVLLAMGYSKERAMSSLRITMGRFTTLSDIKKLVSTLKGLRK